LVLEPDAEDGGALVAALDAAGFQAELVERPNLANALLQVAEQEHAAFELLVVSGMVSGICELDLAAALALRVRAAPAMLISSGPYSAPDADALERAGCAAVVLKPLREDQLRAAIAAAIPAERMMRADSVSHAVILAI
jgi:DNA-binding NarL/FixJ family response regulator